MLFSYNWLKEYIKGRVPEAKRLAELLTFHSFEVESVEKKAGDFVLDIDVLPNRAPDCLSHIGVARECAAILNSQIQIPEFSFEEDKKLKSKDFIKVEVKNPNDCLRYTASVMLNVKVKPSPKWLKDRLKACGLQSINNIVDATNYVMLETGQPLHAFDLDKIKVSLSETKRIIVRRAKRGERIKALDDKTYILNTSDLVIADSKEALAIAGIKGGKKAEISPETKNILIEAANFNRILIRKTSQKLKLRTDASWRFENGIDPNLVDFAQKRVISLIQKLAGGTVLQGVVDFYPKKRLPKKLKLDLNHLNSLLGVNIQKERVKRILKNLGFKLQESGSFLIVEIPTRRLDISIEEDLIEEIGRIYGYQNIPSVFPQASLVPPERNEEIFWENVCKNNLKEMGFCEVYNYSFLGEKEKEIFDLKKVVELENPVSSFNKYLAPSLIPNLLKAVKENLKFFDEVKIFEIAKTFKKSKNTKNKVPGILEKKMLSGALTRKGIKNEGFYELKGIIDSLFEELGISNVWYDDYGQTPEDSSSSIWHPKKCAEIKVAREEIGFLGEIHPRVLKELQIEERVFVFDIDFEKLQRLASEEKEYQPISIHPSVIRDLSVLVPQGTKTVDILNKINSAAGPLVQDVDLFDVYEGGGLPEGKESYAFHIIYQAKDRTLSSREVDKIHQKIIKALEENPEWEVRK